MKRARPLFPEEPTDNALLLHRRHFIQEGLSGPVLRALTLQQKRERCLTSEDGYNWRDYFDRCRTRGYCCQQNGDYRGLTELAAYNNVNVKHMDICGCRVPDYLDKNKIANKFWFPIPGLCKKMWPTHILFATQLPDLNIDGMDLNRKLHLAMLYTRSTFSFHQYIMGVDYIIGKPIYEDFLYHVGGRTIFRTPGSPICYISNTFGDNATMRSYAYKPLTSTVMNIMQPRRSAGDCWNIQLKWDKDVSRVNGRLMVDGFVITTQGRMIDEATLAIEQNRDGPSEDLSDATESTQELEFI